MPPIHIGKALRYLVPTEFESELLGAKVFTKLAGGWTQRAQSSGILFDLSRIEWVELGTVVQLTLLVESALKKGIQVTVALPLPQPRRSEVRWIEHASVPGASERTLDRIDRRRRVLGFLNYLRFTEALHAQHLGDLLTKLTIVTDYDASDPEDDVEDDVGAGDVPRHEPTSESKGLYRYIFPLVWLSNDDQGEQHNIGKFLAGVIGQPERGLEAVDADAIANVILYELVDNVSRHAGRGAHALVAAWARPETSLLKRQDYIDCEQPYIEWLSQRQTTCVEIVVGDSGEGVASTLGKFFRESTVFKEADQRESISETARVLQWAFDRWSSSRPSGELRGTRGLYRVDRVVSKYQGIISIRSDNQMAGIDHGGPSYDERIFAKQQLSMIPGSVLRCRMPSFHEYQLPRELPARSPREIALTIVKLGSVTSNGIEPNALHRLKTELARANSTQPICVVAVADTGIADRTSIEEVLRQSVEIRHPGTLVLCGLPGGWDLTELSIDSVNSEHEAKQRGVESFGPEHFEIWDPVLVIGSNGQFGWVGANGPVLTLLVELLQADQGIISSERVLRLIPEDDSRFATLRYLRNDTNLLRFHDDGQIELLVAIRDIISLTVETLRNYASGNLPKDGILAGQVYRTPSLLLVNKWLDVETIVNKTRLNDIVMFALSEHIKAHEAWKGLGPATMVLADSAVSLGHLEGLRRYLGVSKKETIPGETGTPAMPAARVIPETANVIVYCDVIAASEAVGRCLRQIRRDGAKAIAVACIFDARETPGVSISVPDMEVPVIALTDIHMIVPNASEGAIANISPITKRVEEDHEQTFPYEISKRSLYKLIRKKNAIHFSHIGRPIGRHFTFYLDASGIVDSPIIGDAFNQVINATRATWFPADSATASQANGSALELWFPSPEPKPSEPARRFAENIRKLRSDIKAVHPIRREPVYGQWVFTEANSDSVGYANVVILDWGAVTGATVMQAIRLAAQAGAERLLVCVFLSQLKANEEAFLRSLKSLRVSSSAPILVSGTVPRLLFKEEKLRDITAEVSVKFLAGFPIEAYTPYECPVCNQLGRMSQESYPTTLLGDFAAEQSNVRLHLRTREEVLNTLPMDFDGQPMSTRSILWMVYFRGTLVEALSSTKGRQAVCEHVELLAERLKDSTTSLRKVLWLLQFLSIEAQWLRRPPLYFRAMRDTVANLALTVALNDGVQETDRLNAIVVLRTSNKALFAKNFATLFSSVSQSDRLMKQMLYDAFTYLTRPYHQTPGVFQPLRDALREVQNKIGDSTILLTGDQSGSIAETVDLLTMRAETELAKAGVRLDSPVQSWLKLRNEFSVENYHSHDSVPQAINWMLPGLDGEVIERQIAEVDQDTTTTYQVDPRVVPWLKSLKESWETCSTFLDYNVLPRLAQLKPILLSKDGGDALGNDTIARLIPLLDELSEFRAPVSESEFTHLVNRLSEDPEMILSSEVWANYKTSVAWWGQRILRPGEKDSESIVPPHSGRASRLIRFLSSAPTPLGRTVREVYERMKKHQLSSNLNIRGLEDLADYKVFCTDRLLRDLAKELFANIDRHLNDKEKPVNIWINTQNTVEAIILTVSNDNSVPKEPAGRGLQRLDRRLRAFGGSLISTPRPANMQLSYSVDVMFLKGE